MSTAFLDVQNISKSFSGLKAVSEVSFQVKEQQIVALIGPNGAGKTTIFNTIAGIFPPEQGQIFLSGKSIDGLRPDQICHAGIGRTFQIVKPFNNLTVEDNVTIGALNTHRKIEEAQAFATDILKMLGLFKKRYQQAHSLTLPDRKRLEVARAYATSPKLLLLDEVMAGLRPTEVDRMVHFFRELNQESGLTLLLIEHVMRAVMALAQKVVVINYGQTIFQGDPEQAVQDPAVLECYLGNDHSDKNI